MAYDDCYHCAFQLEGSLLLERKDFEAVIIRQGCDVGDAETEKLEL